MRLSRKITGEFIAVFLIGAIVGGLVEWDFTDTELSQFMTKTNDPESVMVARANKKYAETYHLSSEEIQRIQPLLKEMAQHISQVRRQFGIDIIATLNEYHQKIADQLTPEHRAAYQKATDDREKQISSMLLLDPNASSPVQK